jgi:hypothetical protein
MANPRPQSKKKRRGQESSRKKKGVIAGMRSGFKGVASAVTGVDEDKQKKSPLLSTIITIVVVILVAVFLLYR